MSLMPERDLEEAVAQGERRPEPQADSTRVAGTGHAAEVVGEEGGRGAPGPMNSPEDMQPTYMESMWSTPASSMALEGGLDEDGSAGTSPRARPTWSCRRR